MIPYVVRLEHLGQSWMWTELRPAVGRWLDQCRKQVGYSGVADHTSFKKMVLDYEAQVLRQFTATPRTGTEGG